MSNDAQPVTARFPFIAWLFKQSDSVDIAGANFLRDLSKGFFDLVRNLVIVGGLKFFSERTGNAYLSFAYSASVIVLGCVYRKPYPGLLSEESAKLAR
jgi:hypothetical protein